MKHWLFEATSITHWSRISLAWSRTLLLIASVLGLRARDLVGLCVLGLAD